MSRDRMRRGVAIAIAVVVIGAAGWWVLPYTKHPALFKDESAVTTALGDAAAAGLIRQTTHNYIFTAGPRGPKQMMPKGPLCSPEAVRAGKAVTAECLIWKASQVKGCSNLRACAAVEFDPATLADPQFGAVVRDALRRPCDALPLDPAAFPHRVIVPMRLTLSADRRILGCGTGAEIKGTLDNAASSPGAVIVHF